MRHSHEILRIGLASAALYSIPHPVLNGVITSSLLLSFLLKPNVKLHDDIDPISNMLNFTAFKRTLNELLLRETCNPDETRRVYVASIDILGYASISNSHGHAGERRAIQKVARTINQQSVALATSRPFGDVFLLAYIEDCERNVVQDLHSIIEKVECSTDTLGFKLELCSGIALVDDGDTDDSVDVISSAITKSEVARLIGKKEALKINFYKKRYIDKDLEKIKMEDALSRSIRNNEISVFYQPKIDTKSNRVAGFESLCRWYHEPLGFISPAFFIPLAEDSGFIQELGHYVIEESCKTMVELRESGYTDISFAVNVSICQLEYLEGKPLISHIRHVIEKYKIEPRLFELEITESMAAKDFELIRHHVVTLREMGVIVSLDDFGTGESSLYRLKELPLHQLKIDKAFVDDVCTEKGAELMVGIFKIAKAMNLTTVAEGVESKEQAEKLTSLGCTYLQGYFLGKPLPKEFIKQILDIKNP